MTLRTTLSGKIAQNISVFNKIGCMESRNPYGKSWEELISLDRLFLLEVACSERSILSEEVLSRHGPNSAMRCAHWNGFDLTTRSGVEKLKQLVRERRPKHIWISCECGPFSPLQRINQRTPKQCEELQRKRESAVQQYLGGIEVARFGRRYGSQIHWELSEKCEAWNLPIIHNHSWRNNIYEGLHAMVVLSIFVHMTLVNSCVKVGP